MVALLVQLVSNVPRLMYDAAQFFFQDPLPPRMPALV
jgi:hypothetical protein